MSTTCHDHKPTGPLKPKPCPICLGKKVVPGTCVCNMEWRGTQTETGWEDCQCTPEVTCTQCNGTGSVLAPE